MRKISLTSILITIFSILILISCQEDDPEFTSIKIKTAPSKIVYFEGDDLDLSGLVVTLNLDNGKSEDIDFLNFANEGISCNPINGSELTLTSTSIVITHDASGMSVNQTIVVTKLKVTDIALKNPPTKLEYFIGEALDLSGLEVTIYMNDGTTKDITVGEFEIYGITSFPLNGTILSEPVMVTINHNDTDININQEIILKLKDFDNNAYPIVKIGKQIWMAENLKTKHYANGDIIDDGTGILNHFNEPTPKYWFA